jgi:phospholipid-binding lipoprotein MlaA
MLAVISAMLITGAPVQLADDGAGTTSQVSSIPSGVVGLPPAALTLPSKQETPASVSPEAMPTSPTQATPPIGVSPVRMPPTPQNDIVVTGRKESAGDPLRAVNAESFAVTQKVDNAVIGPVARTYKKAVPSPIRHGVHNFLYNLREPIVFLNFLLQIKPGKAAETVGRFAINSTLGAVGVLDIAKRKPFRLPRRSNGFANTLGYYGVKNGPFLFLPLVGPTTVRDLFGGAIDRLILPVGVGKPFTSATYTAPAGVLGALDHRSEFDQTLKDLHDNSPDPYAATRAFYLNRRQAEIDRLHGRGEGDPAGMSEPPPSVRPFVPKNLEPGAALRPVLPGIPASGTTVPSETPLVESTATETPVAEAAVEPDSQP